MTFIWTHEFRVGSVSQNCEVWFPDEEEINRRIDRHVIWHECVIETFTSKLPNINKNHFSEWPCSKLSCQYFSIWVSNSLIPPISQPFVDSNSTSKSTPFEKKRHTPDEPLGPETNSSVGRRDWINSDRSFRATWDSSLRRTWDLLKRKNPRKELWVFLSFDSVWGKCCVWCVYWYISVYIYIFVESNNDPLVLVRCWVVGRVRMPSGF